MVNLGEISTSQHRFICLFIWLICDLCHIVKYFRFDSYQGNGWEVLSHMFMLVTCTWMKHLDKGRFFYNWMKTNWKPIINLELYWNAAFSKTPLLIHMLYEVKFHWPLHVRLVSLSLALNVKIVTCIVVPLWLLSPLVSSRGIIDFLYLLWN